MGFLAGKRFLITGVLNQRSIAWGIAQACHREGAELAFSYQGERFRERITEYAAELGSKLVFDCDVGDDAQIERLFTSLGEQWPAYDGFVHSIGYAPREAIAGGADIQVDIQAADQPGLRASAQARFIAPTD